MNRYILIPEDTIRVLPPEDGVEAAVEGFCSRTYAPKTLDFSKEADYIPESCDHNGHHHG